MTKTEQKSAQKGSTKQTGNRPLDVDFSQIEFHRHGLALFPDPSDKRPGIAVFVQDPASDFRQRFCSCSLYKQRTCNHLQKLTRVARALDRRLNGKTLEEDFRASMWHRLAEILSDGCRETPDTVRN